MNTNDGKFQNDIDGLDKLTTYNLENIFRVYFDVDNNTHYYNICNTVFFPDELDQSMYTTYRVTGKGISWTYLSYIYYGTIKLWWLICMVNNIDNPIILPEPGKELKILTPDAVRIVLQEIQQNK